MSIFGEDFKIENYIKPVNEFVDERKRYNFGALSYTQDDVDAAIDQAERQMKVIIYPTATLEELEKLWMDFNLQPFDYRIKSDRISLEFFGIINQYHYEILRSEFLKDDIEGYIDEEIDDYPLDESAFDNTAEFDNINYTPADVEAAIDWSNDSGLPIIHPVRTLEELETLWTNWNSYHKKLRRISDWRSIELFGVGNIKHYQYLRSQFLKDDIKPETITESFIGDAIISHERFCMNEDVDTATRARDLLTLITKKNENYDDVLARDIVDKVTGEYIASNQNIKYDNIPFEDLPFFTPEEMIDFGVNQANPEDNFYGCEPIQKVIGEDTSISDWFNNYCNTCVGFGYKYDSLQWKDAISNLYLKMNHCEDNEFKNKYKQSILSLGWPPEMDFSPENRVKATKRIKSIVNMGSTQFVDLTGMTAEEDIHEAVEDGVLKPVFIVLQEGTTIFSKTIKKFTDSNFSHASISFDPALHEMYSYGIEGSEKGFVGGFIKEDIKNNNPDTHLAVFTIFLKKEDWQKLKDNVEFFLKNIQKTAYSYLNIIASFVFRIPLNMHWKMICSQFVDRMLKLIDIDLTNRDSSKVAPADIERAAKENKKIYIVFNDFVSKFKPSRVKAMITRLVHGNKALPIKESIHMTDSVGIAYEMMNHIRSLSAMQELATKIDINHIDVSVKKIYETMIAPCLEAECYTEAKDFPMQFDKEGNLFIKNVKRKDYEGEYAKSHRLLRKYEKNNNIEGMKYELCKLWMMNSVIEEVLHSKKFEKLPSMAIETSKEARARAKILNDFNYFLDIVLAKEPDFNFQEYFNDSPFNDALIKINKDTLIWSGKLLKQLMTNLL